MLTPDGYTLAKPVRELGSTARLYRATREADGREVVLKIFPERSTALKEAQREADALRACAGAGVPALIELVSTTRVPVLVIEQVRGLPLEAWVGRELPASAAALEIAAQLAAILVRVHAAHLVHRAVTPESVYVDPATTCAWLVDFGRAQPLGALSQASVESALSPATLAYAAPEQTGRMNRGVEFRSDLYSLGATLYFLWTGRPPFEDRDPLALIHAHMARTPASPASLRPELGHGLARILLRLLSKQPEDRYPSARSLLDDLRRGQAELAERGTVSDDFAAGAAEVRDRPRFSRTLHGRERELETLAVALDRASRGELQALLIRGDPGAGKSALVEAVRGPLARRGGYLAGGKFEQYGERPFAGLIGALESLTHQLLAESDQRLTRWRDEIRAGVGSIAGALVERVPDLGIVLGDVQPVPPLGPRETQARLSLAFSRFVSACATPEHPLALFLDDLQWADTGSRFVLEELLGELPSRTALLVIGACRRQSSPELESVFRSRPSRAPDDECLIELEPLAEPACARMLAEALGEDAERMLALARLVERKTGNSPLLIQEFIGHIHDCGLLRHDLRAGWTWDPAAIASAQLPEGAVDLLMTRIERVSSEGRRLLELASCVGDTFDVERLRELAADGSDWLESGLYALAEAGLIVPCDSGFRFAHDRIREAAQALLPVERRTALHCEIARRLLERVPEADWDERALEIADQLDRGLSLLPEELRPTTLRLNLLAARRALAAGAASVAGPYLAVARSLFGEDDWRTQREVGFDLHLKSAESAFQTGDVSGALALLDRLEEREPSALEQARIAIRRIQVNALMQPPEPCMRYVLSVLRGLGVRWPLRPSRLRVRLELLRVRFMLGKRSARDALRPATSIDPHWLALVLVLGASASTTSRFDYNFSILTGALVMRRNLRHGYVARPAFTLAAYVMQSYYVLRDAAEARRRVADVLLLEEQAPDPVYGPRTSVLLHALLHPWLMRRREALEPLESTWERIRELGDTEYAYYTRFMYIYYRAIAGDPLADTENRLRELVALVERSVHLYRAPRGCLEAFVALREANVAELGRRMAEHEPELAADTSGAPYRRTAWLIVLSIFDRQQLAFAQSEALGERLFQVSPYVHLADHMLHRGIAAAALCEGLSWRASRRYRRALRQAHRLLHRYARDGPDFPHMAWLLDAELARVRGNAGAAQAFYRRSAQRALQQSFAHHAALAHERRGRMLIALNRTTEAATAFADALAHYRDWGAQAKVDALEKERAQLLR